MDTGNNRIVGSGPNGFRCLVGCSGSGGSASNQLNSPETLSFDSYGNMFVTDWWNNRIQKFVLSTNSCGKYKSIHLKSNSFKSKIQNVENTKKSLLLDEQNEIF